jgi:NADPH2 dehydrogenase
VIRLIDELKVKGLTLKCRIVMAPMATESATQEGAITEKLIEHYVKRSRSLGLLIVEHSFISLQGKLSKNQLGIHNDCMIPGLKKLVQCVQSKGTPIVAQINHAGACSIAKITGTPPVGPSSTKGVHELSVSEIKELSYAFTLAAERAMIAGFDAVEIHGAHGFLLNQFFAQSTNKRRDNYGGSLENRMRFPLEVVERLRRVVGEKVLMFRLGIDNFNPVGTVAEDTKQFALKLQEAGIDIFDFSGGFCGSNPEKTKGIQGYFVNHAHQIKEIVNVPVIGVGGIKDPNYANKLVQNGTIDLIAVGREIFKDPEWALKALQTCRES